MSQEWPVAELDPVRRLRVVAAATPGVIYAEELIPAPFSQVWAVASDLENELPRVVGDVQTFEITSSAGERLQARVRSRLGLRARFDVVLRPALGVPRAAGPACWVTTGLSSWSGSMCGLTASSASRRTGVSCSHRCGPPRCSRSQQRMRKRQAAGVPRGWAFRR